MQFVENPRLFQMGCHSLSSLELLTQYRTMIGPSAAQTIFIFQSSRRSSDLLRLLFFPCRLFPHSFKIAAMCFNGDALVQIDTLRNTLSATAFNIQAKQANDTLKTELYEGERTNREIKRRNGRG